MNKTMIAAASTILAATAFVPTAEAGFRIRFGGFHHHHHHHRFFHRPYVHSYSAPVHEEYRVKRKRSYAASKPAAKPVEKVAAARYSDSQGRIYDPASKTWFDGKDQCWSGKQAFMFKGGSWFYGASLWKQVNGAWQTAAAEPPSPVGCDTVPAFAAMMKPATAAKSNADKPEAASAASAPATPAESPLKTAEKGAQPALEQKPAAPAGQPAKAECKKYVPSIGEMVSVPCE